MVSKRPSLEVQNAPHLCVIQNRMQYDILKIEKLSTQQVRIYVNGNDLLELVRKEEIPLSQSEYIERTGDGEELSDNPEFLAGDYISWAPESIKYPSSFLLDSPYIPGFEFEENDPSLKKSTLYCCTCGIPDCWLFRCLITVRDEIVIWSDFEQFHRSWQYGFGPFIFDYEQYLNELKNI